MPQARLAPNPQLLEPPGHRRCKRHPMIGIRMVGIHHNRIDWPDGIPATGSHSAAASRASLIGAGLFGRFELHCVEKLPVIEHFTPEPCVDQIAGMFNELPV